MKDPSSAHSSESEVATSPNYEIPGMFTPQGAGMRSTPAPPQSANAALNSLNRLSPSSSLSVCTASPIPGDKALTAKSAPSSPLRTLTGRFKPPQWRPPQCELHPLSPTDLANELANDAQSVLIIDVRPYTMFSITRIKSAISICIPSTLLKRQTFGFRRIVEFVAPQDVETLQRVEERSHIVFYDQRTTHCGTDSSLRRTAAKFFDADPGLAPKLHWLVGGIVAASRDTPDLLESEQISPPSPSRTSAAGENAEEPPKLTISSIRAAPRSPFSLLPVVTEVGTALRSPLSTSSRQPPLDNSSSIHVDGEIASRLSEFPQWLVAAVQNTERGHNVLAEAFQRLQAAEYSRIRSAKTSQRPDHRSDTLQEPQSGRLLASHMRTDTPWSTPTTPFSDASALSTHSSNTSPLDLKHEYAHKQRARQQNQLNKCSASRASSQELSPNGNPADRKPSVETLQPTPPSLPGSSKSARPAATPASSLTAAAPSKELPESMRFAIVAGDDPRKNRYTNIAPFNYNRVLVRGTEYLNASYVRSSMSQLQYIATQAPVPAAFGDFWWCVFEHRVPLIVMLTTLRTESGQIKSNKYWFDSNYDGLEVRLVQEHPEDINGAVAGLYVRVIELRYEDTVHKVVHFQYENWPDLGCPADPRDVLDLVDHKKHLIQQTGKEDSYVVVHCSAGCGRTGTFCTIDTVTDFLSRLSPQEAHQDPEDRVMNVVSEFRQQRMAMVQNQRQLLLCYEAVMIWYLRYLEGSA